MSVVNPKNPAAAGEVAFPRAASAEFRAYLSDLIYEMCAIDTTPHADVARSAQAEGQVFDIIERALHAIGLAGATHERRPIDPRIAEHRFFTPLYYTQTADAPAGLDAARAYAGRSNLLVHWAGSGGGCNQAINVHIDVVRPFFGPRRDGDIIHSRGACDNKGNVAALLGALALLQEHVQARGTRLNGDLTCMFVIDEETGGNGSLACAIDRRLKAQYDSLLVLECTSGRLHPGNRGCVWYRVEGAAPGVNLFEATGFIIAELEDEGRAIRAESNHPLYPHRPVQTCHGIIGACGEHPSRINGDVSFHIDFASKDAAGRVATLIDDVLADGLRTYTALYGDKTEQLTPRQTARLERHYEVRRAGDGFIVRVLGLTGHMSAIQDNDGAITKLAALVRALVRSRPALERIAGGTMTLSLADWPDVSRLVLEGGQGFVPTHALEEVEQRVRAAVVRGMRRYRDIVGIDGDATSGLRVSFDKLHNAAFARPVESADVVNAVNAAREAGLPAEPLVGWDASCDSRIFACEYPELPVITTGAGALQDAHSDREHIDVREVARVAEFLARFVLRQTGTA
ncbi:MAG: M20/M25/M40 family metallo-hydrolase [Phycisphaerales bacterium]|nr:M20/M25/M40 family metallo-hydrolase [Phycisphaerales bacterium]